MIRRSQRWCQRRPMYKHVSWNVGVSWPETVDTHGKKDPSIGHSSACHRLFVSDGLFTHLMFLSLYRRTDAEEQDIFDFKKLQIYNLYIQFEQIGIFFLFFPPQTFKNDSRCARYHNSRLCFRGWIQPTAVSVHVPALSWRSLPALTSLCRGRPDAVSWWGSASECRLNTADLQPVRRGLGLACSQDHLFAKSLSPALLNRVLKVLSSLTNVGVDDGLLWPSLRHHLPPETKKIASQESTETNYKLMENVKIELRWLYLEWKLATIDFLSFCFLLSF